MRYERFDPTAAEENRLRQQRYHAKRKAKRLAKRERRRARKEQKRQQSTQPATRPGKQRHAKRSSVYKTEAWKRLRYEVLTEQKSTCQLCGATPLDGVRMNVDHIYPLNSHPHLALVKSNLRVLCSSCNWGKGGRNPDDYEGTMRQIPSSKNGLFLGTDSRSSD